MAHSIRRTDGREQSRPLNRSKKKEMKMFVVSRYILEKKNKVFVQDIGPSHSSREEADKKLHQTRQIFTQFHFEVREVVQPKSTLKSEQDAFDESEYVVLEQQFTSGEINPDDFRRLSYLRGLRELKHSAKLGA